MTSRRLRPDTNLKSKSAIGARRSQEHEFGVSRAEYLWDVRSCRYC